jgi:hypothetical protein
MSNEYTLVFESEEEFGLSNQMEVNGKKVQVNSVGFGDQTEGFSEMKEYLDDLHKELTTGGIVDNEEEADKIKKLLVACGHWYSDEEIEAQI